MTTGRSAALFRYSRNRSGDDPVEHLKTFSGIFQADVYAVYNALYVARRSPGPIIGGACWGHSRRKFYEVADIATSKRRDETAPPISPLAPEAVKRIDVHRQAQQCRSAGLARRCSRPDRGDAADAARRTPSLELCSGAKALSCRIGPIPPGAPSPTNSARNTPRSSVDGYTLSALDQS